MHYTSLTRTKAISCCLLKCHEGNAAYSKTAFNGTHYDETKI